MTRHHGRELLTHMDPVMKYSFDFDCNDRITFEKKGINLWLTHSRSQTNHGMVLGG